MTPHLSPAGYAQTKTKLANLEKRLVDILNRTDLSARQVAAARRSYEQMIRQYRREIKLYEAHLSRQTSPSDHSS